MGTLHNIFGKKQSSDPIDEFIRKSTREAPDAGNQVVALGAAIVDQLLPLLIDDKQHPFAVRCNTIRALAKIGDSRAVAPVIALLKDSDNMIRVEASNALGAFKDVRAVMPLVDTLRGSNALSSAAARALGRIGDARAVEPLITLLSDCYECGREAAAEALGLLRDQRAVPSLLQALSDDDHAVRKLAADALERIGWQPADAAIKATFLVAKQNWAGCVQMGHNATPQLIQALRSADFETTWNAGNALVAIGAPAVDDLRACLSDGNADFRADVMRILGQIGVVKV